MSKENIFITPYISFDVTIVFHHNGNEEEVSLDNIADISTHPKTGKTMLTYYTDNPDCEHDWFEIDETVEDAKQTVKEAEKLLQEERKKYEIKLIQWFDKNNDSIPVENSGRKGYSSERSDRQRGL